MRKIIVLVSLVLVVVGAPALVSAQSLLGLSSFIGTGSGLDEPVISFSGLTGYATNAGMTKFKLTAGNAGVGGVRERLLEYEPTHALYLGADIPIDFGKMGKTILSGAVALPATWNLYALDFALPNEAAPFGGRGWKGDTIWITMQGLWAYPIGYFSAVGGLRWDHWQTSLKDCFNISPGFAVAAPTDTAALTLNSYIPVIGGITEYQGFVFGVVGFPWLPGDFEFEEVRNAAGPRYDSGSGNFDRGWFVEFFSEYGLPMPGLVDFEGTISLFGKVSLMEARSKFTLTRQTSGETDTFDFVFNRTMFVVGGKASVNFNIPNVWGSL